MVKTSRDYVRAVSLALIVNACDANSSGSHREIVHARLPTEIRARWILHGTDAGILLVSAGRSPNTPIPSSRLSLLEQTTCVAMVSIMRRKQQRKCMLLTQA